jgi:hypothetical protein
MDKDEESTVFHPIEQVAKDGKPRTSKRCRKVFIALFALLKLVLLLSLAQNSETTTTFFWNNFFRRHQTLCFYRAVRTYGVINSVRNNE